MPAPKLAMVAPCTKFVYCVAIAILTLVAAATALGVSEVITGGGLTISVDVLPVTKLTPDDVVPDTDTM